MLGGALAASVAGVAAIRPPLELWPSVFELEANYRTGVGEQRQLALVEGASVQMNTRTSLSLTSDLRAIELVAGEASFQIAPQATSFSVLAANGRTSATDARFDIRIDGASIRVDDASSWRHHHPSLTRGFCPSTCLRLTITHHVALPVWNPSDLRQFVCDGGIAPTSP